MQIADRKKDSTFYTFLQNYREAEIHRSSSVRPEFARWIVYSEYIYTKADYLRDVSIISPEWIFESSPTYFDEQLFQDSIMKTDLFEIKRRLDQNRTSQSAIHK